MSDEAYHDLVENCDRLRAVFDNAFQFIGLLSPDGTLLEANRSSLESVGTTREEAIGRPFWETAWWVHSPPLQRRLREAIERGARGELDRFDATHRVTDGSVIDVDFSLTPVKDDAGRIIYLLPEGRNITARKKQAKQDALDGEARLHAILDTAVDAIITIDEHGIVETWNQAAQKLFGYEDTEVIGRNVSQLMPPPYREEHDEYIARYIATGERKIIGIGREVVGRRKNGTSFPMHLAVSEVQLSDRRIFTGIVRDVSNLKDTQQKLVQSERLAAVGEMLSGIAHESRNALQRIQAGVEMLQLELKDNPEALGDLARIERAGDNLHTLYEELRSYAAPIQLDRNICDLSVIWRRAWSNLAEIRDARDATLDEQVSDVALECLIDEFRIEQVFRNLLENSIAACPDPVRIQIECIAGLYREQPSLCVTVRDNGPGFSEKHQPRLFDAFFTTKPKGTGLGLAIAKRIVEAHGGWISAGTDGSSGAVVRIELPIA